MHKINHGLTSLLFSMLSLWSIFFAFIACAHAVVEGQDDFITAIDPALGISVQLGRWNGPINLVYDPDGAPALFSEADEVLALLTDKLLLSGSWSVVSGLILLVAIQMCRMMMALAPIIWMGWCVCSGAVPVAPPGAPGRKLIFMTPMSAIFPISMGPLS